MSSETRSHQQQPREALEDTESCQHVISSHTGVVDHSGKEDSLKYPFDPAVAGMDFFSFKQV